MPRPRPQLNHSSCLPRRALPRPPRPCHQLRAIWSSRITQARLARPVAAGPAARRSREGRRRLNARRQILRRRPPQQSAAGTPPSARALSWGRWRTARAMEHAIPMRLSRDIADISKVREGPGADWSQSASARMLRAACSDGFPAAQPPPPPPSPPLPFSCRGRTSPSGAWCGGSASREFRGSTSLRSRTRCLAVKSASSTTDAPCSTPQG